MAKSKYDEETFPMLAEGYARRGLSDEQIAAKLGVSKPTFYKYCKDHVNFFNALKRGKAPVDFEVENALLKRALGYEYTERSIITRQDDEGKSYTIIKEVTKHVIPDVGAIMAWLKNRLRNEWKDRWDIDFNFTQEAEKIMMDMVGNLDYRQIKQIADGDFKVIDNTMKEIAAAEGKAK